MKIKIKKIWYIISFLVLYLVISFFSGILTLTLGFNVDSLKGFYLMCLLSNLVFIFQIFFFYKNKISEKFFCIKKLNMHLIFFLVFLAYLFSAIVAGTIDCFNIEKYFPNSIWFKNIGTAPPALIMISSCVVVPIGEETLFRGIILSRLREITNTKIAIIVQAVIFSLMHFDYVQSFYAFFIGIVLGILFLWFKIIWVSVIVHSVSNFALNFAEFHWMNNFFAIFVIFLIFFILFRYLKALYVKNF